VQSHSNKFLEECLRTKLQNYANQKTLTEGLLKNQHGFIHGRSTASAQLSMKEKVERMNSAANKDNTCALFFLDVKDAYGSVLLPKLFKYIEEWNFWSKEEVAALKFLYDNTYLRFNGSVGRTTKGLFQGAKLSC